MNILVVEDEPLVALELEAILTDAGHHVRGPAKNFVCAIALAEEEIPDVALLDINLGQGRGSGIDLARALLDRWSVPSIFITGHLFQAHAHTDLALGIVAKPYRPGTILSAIEVVGRMMAGRSPEPVPAGFEVFAITPPGPP